MMLVNNLCYPFKYDLRCALFFPSFLCEIKLNTTERGAAEVIFERVTEIISSRISVNNIDVAMK